MNYQTFAYDVCRCFVEDLDGLLGADVTNKVLGWIRNRDVIHLTTCSDYFPLAFHEGDKFRALRQIQAFFKKNASIDGPFDQDAEAYTTFLRGELLCRITNRRVQYFAQRPDRLDPALLANIERVKSVISYTLGNFREFLDELPELVRVTAGASSTLSRRNALPYLKIRKRGLCSTVRASKYIDALSTHWGYKANRYCFLQHNRVEVVPKNWKTGRTIACEPEGNVFLQLAGDSYIKNRLKRNLNVDLSDQSRNQELARLGSIDGSLATLDLSMASDTLAYNLVAELLPFEWFKFFNDVRSPLGFFKATGEVLTYAKFSSMGNGATFSLETLVFAACCKAVGSTRFSVYGDDIIIESELYRPLTLLLGYFGFKVNDEKSYHTGPFRESCGADWHLGTNVTPFYLRQNTNQLNEMCHNVNGLAALCNGEGKLSLMLRKLIKGLELPLVPFNHDTQSGVWVDCHTAYALNLIRRTNYITQVKVLAIKQKTKVIYDSRTLFLWHLEASSKAPVRVPQPFRKLPGWRRHVGLADIIDKGTFDGTPSSRVSTLSTKYVRRWEAWNPPSMVTPVHLFWWSDFITHVKVGMKVRA
jgi:hypothetical protein